MWRDLEAQSPNAILIPKCILALYFLKCYTTSFRKMQISKNHLINHLAVAKNFLPLITIFSFLHQTLSGCPDQATESRRYSAQNKFQMVLWILNRQQSLIQNLNLKKLLQQINLATNSEDSPQLIPFKVLKLFCDLGKVSFKLYFSHTYKAF